MKKTFLFIICGVMALTLVTGCGNEKQEKQNNSNNDNNVSETKNTVMTCTYESQAENEHESNTKNTEEFTYTKDMILISVKTIREEEYSTEEEAKKRKEQEEQYVTRANKYDGVKAIVETKNNTTFIVTYNYDMAKIDKDSVLGSGAKQYIDSNNKFSANEYKANLLETHNGRNASCTEK